MRPPTPGDDSRPARRGVRAVPAPGRPGGGQTRRLLLSDIEALTLLVREMESVAARCERLEQQRLAAAGHLMDPLDESFDALAPYFVGDQRVRLTGLRDDLRDSVGRLRDLNGMNAALVQQAVLVTDQWLRLLRASSPATYTRAGALSGAPTGTRYTYAV
ncbi:MAG: flagellar protein FlgN [Dehalococcoidia bacterium]